MFVFERLVSKDFQSVYYVIKDARKDIFNLYTQDENAIWKITMSQNWAQAFFELYMSLYKTRREELKDSMMEWKIPVYSKCINLGYKTIAQERKKRELKGLPTRLMLKE